MSEKKVKRLSKTITKEIIIEEVNKEELKPGEVKHISAAKRPQRVSKADVVQRNQTPDNSKCCGIFSCCSSHTTISGNNNSVNTDKNTNANADVNIGIKK